jgi:hypothetical protein
MHLETLFDDLEGVVAPPLHMLLAVGRRAEGRHGDRRAVLRGWDEDVCHVVVLPAVPTYPPPQALGDQDLQQQGEQSGTTTLHTDA